MPREARRNHADHRRVESHEDRLAAEELRGEGSLRRSGRSVHGWAPSTTKTVLRRLGRQGTPDGHAGRDQLPLPTRPTRLAVARRRGRQAARQHDGRDGRQAPGLHGQAKSKLTPDDLAKLRALLDQHALVGSDEDQLENGDGEDEAMIGGRDRSTPGDQGWASFMVPGPDRLVESCWPWSSWPGCRSGKTDVGPIRPRPVPARPAQTGRADPRLMAHLVGRRPDPCRGPPRGPRRLGVGRRPSEAPSRPAAEPVDDPIVVVLDPPSRSSPPPLRSRCRSPIRSMPNLGSEGRRESDPCPDPARDLGDLDARLGGGVDLRNAGAVLPVDLACHSALDPRGGAGPRGDLGWFPVDFESLRRTAKVQARRSDGP